MHQSRMWPCPVTFSKYSFVSLGHSGSSFMKNVWLVCLCALVFAASSSLFGQAASGTANIGGVVTDPMGSVVAGADVVVRNVGTNVSRALKTNEDGIYEAVSLQPGDYEIKASKPGFATLTRTGITLSIGQRARADLDMKISTITE